ncbi:hypothetical protein [Shinella zoogloeoides]
MTQSEEKRTAPPLPSDEDIERQLKAARIIMEKYEGVLRELAKH